MQEGGTAYVEVKLSPLSHEDIADLLVDSFMASRGDVAPLAKALIEKTEGNPFFVHRLLTQLHDNELFLENHPKNHFTRS